MRLNLQSNQQRGRHSVHFTRLDSSQIIPSYDQTLDFESTAVLRIVESLVEEFGQKVSIFIVTPHRAQRTSVSLKLAHLISKERVKVDTVEKMQGKECDILIALYSFFDFERLANEIDFVFDINRANVALSRAKYHSILMVTDAVVRPSLTVYSKPKTFAAFTFLKSFYDTCRVIEWPYVLKDHLLEESFRIG